MYRIVYAIILALGFGFLINFLENASENEAVDYILVKVLPIGLFIVLAFYSLPWLCWKTN